MPAHYGDCLKASYLMEDSEGDRGVFTGEVDTQGNAHGYGQLEYMEEPVFFIGKFLSGKLEEGVTHYNDSNDIHETMQKGKWTEDVNSRIAKDHPKYRKVSQLALYARLKGRCVMVGETRCSVRKVFSDDSLEVEDNEGRVKRVEREKWYEQELEVGGGYMAARREDSGTAMEKKSRLFKAEPQRKKSEDPGWNPGDAAQYYSPSSGDWIDCEITGTDPQKGVQISVKPGAWLNSSIQSRQLRKLRSS